MMFFCRGVLETLQMLGWSPDIIHCHGWFTSLLPLYMKKLYREHPVFSDTRIISSLYKNSFTGTLDKNLIDKIKFDGIDDDILDLIKKPNSENLYKIAAQFSDGIVFEKNYENKNILDFGKNNGIPLLNPTEHEEYYNFYQNFFSEELV